MFEGKDKGLVVDYIGIRKAMLEALKQYGGDQGNQLMIYQSHLVFSEISLPSLMICW